MLSRLYLWEGINASSQECHGISTHKATIPSHVVMRSLKVIWIFQRQKNIALRWLKHTLQLLEHHSLSDTCQLLRSLKHPLSAALTQHLYSTLEEGHTLSDALNQLPCLFPVNIRRWLKIAEQCNQVHTLGLQSMADYEQQRSFKKSIRQKLSYPILLFIACLFVFVGLLEYLIPSMNDLYQDTQLKPPAIIHSLLTIRDHLGSIGIIVAIIATLSITLLKHRWQFCLKHTKSYQSYLLGEWMHCLSHLLLASIPLPMGLSHAAFTLPSSWLKKCESVKTTLLQGHSFSKATRDLPGMTPLLEESLTLGEINNTLANTLSFLACQLRQNLIAKQKRMLKKTQTIAMIALSGMIGGLFYLMYAPMLHLSP